MVVSSPDVSHSESEAHHQLQVQQAAAVVWSTLYSRQGQSPEEALECHLESVQAAPCGWWLPWNQLPSWCDAGRQMPDRRHPPRTGLSRAVAAMALLCQSG